MRYLWIAVTTLALAACGQVEDGETQSYEQNTIDLRVADQSHEVAVDGAQDVNVVRRDGQVVPLNDWMADLGQRHGINIHERLNPDHDRLTIRAGGPSDIGEQQQVQGDGPADGLDDEQAGVGACPETCLHCPEDNAFLCAQLCQ